MSKGGRLRRFSAFISPRHRCHGEKKQRRFHSGDISFTVSWYGRSTGNLTAFPEPVCAPSANVVPGQGSRRCFSYPPPWGEMSFRFSPCRRWLGMLACFPAASAMGGRLRLAVLGTLRRFRRFRLLAGVGQSCSPFPSLVKVEYDLNQKSSIKYLIQINSYYIIIMP